MTEFRVGDKVQVELPRGYSKRGVLGISVLFTTSPEARFENAVGTVTQINPRGPHSVHQYLVDFRPFDNSRIGIPWQAHWFREEWLTLVERPSSTDLPPTPPTPPGAPVRAEDSEGPFAKGASPGGDDRTPEQAAQEQAREGPPSAALSQSGESASRGEPPETEHPIPSSSELTNVSANVRNGDVSFSGMSTQLDVATEHGEGLHEYESPDERVDVADIELGSDVGGDRVGTGTGFLSSPDEHDAAPVSSDPNVAVDAHPAEAHVAGDERPGTAGDASARAFEPVSSFESSAPAAADLDDFDLPGGETAFDVASGRTPAGEETSTVVDETTGTDSSPSNANSTPAQARDEAGTPRSQDVVSVEPTVREAAGLRSATAAMGSSEATRPDDRPGGDARASSHGEAADEPAIENASGRSNDGTQTAGSHADTLGETRPAHSSALEHAQPGLEAADAAAIAGIAGVTAAGDVVGVAELSDDPDAEVLISSVPPEGIGAEAGPDDVAPVTQATADAWSEIGDAALVSDGAVDESDLGAATNASVLAAPSGSAPGLEGETPGIGYVRAAGDRDCPPDYPIKGNASSKIFHLPGQSSYDATVPEICFATAEDAVAAGYRPRKGGSGARDAKRVFDGLAEGGIDDDQHESLTGHGDAGHASAAAPPGPAANETVAASAEIADDAIGLIAGGTAAGGADAFATADIADAGSDTHRIATGSIPNSSPFDEDESGAHAVEDGAAAHPANVRAAGGARSRTKAESSAASGGEGVTWVRAGGERDCPAEFPMKGNASSKIFHAPGQPSYDATIPEICFASAEAALAAGFRARKSSVRAVEAETGDTSERHESGAAHEAESHAGNHPAGGEEATGPESSFGAELAAGAQSGDGWVRSDGTRYCPEGFPIKGNANSMIYHRPADDSYRPTIAEVCFATEEDAEAAGFRPRSGSRAAHPRGKGKSRR